MNAIQAPALRFHGGKWRDASWIMSHFPTHVCYVEPYAGGANVLLQKVPTTQEVINDLDSNVVNFFRVLREQEAELIRAIELTPYSREEHALAHVGTDNPVERARRFYVRCWQSYAPTMGNIWQSGWRFQQKANNGASVIAVWNRTEHLHAIAKRLKLVQIEHDQATVVISRFDTPDTLFYVDPPYVLSTRSKWQGKAYAHEMTEDDHRQLAKVLHDTKGMVILSGYATELYVELYAGWECKTKAAIDIQAKPKIECLWLSPNASGRLKSEAEKVVTLDMFASTEGLTA